MKETTPADSLAARRLALAALRRVFERKATLPKSLELSGASRQPPAIRAAAWDISYTMLRHLGPLLGALEKHERKQALAGRGFGLGLLLGLADVLLAGKQPFTAVNLWVEVLKREGLPKDAGALNARLRRLLETPPALDLTIVHPADLPERLAHLGEDRAARFIAATHASPHQMLVNLARSGGDWERAGYSPEGWPIIFTPAPDALGPEDGKLRQALDTGQALLVDAQSAALALSLPVGASLLDVCAGSGVKSRLVRERKDKPGRHVLITNERLANLAVWRACQDRARVSPLKAVPEKERFDAVWVDAPCTGSGTLARNPEIALRLTPARVDKLVQTQMQLLLQSANAVKPGGHLVYLTCSLLQAENEDVIAAFRKLRPDFRSRKAEIMEQGFPIDILPVSGGLYLLPRDGAGDHFFAAILRRDQK